MRIKDLPYDMQVLLDQWTVDSGKVKDGSFLEFVERDVPVRMIKVSAFPEPNPRQMKDDRDFESYAKTPFYEYPPVIVAHGHFLDGQHRLYAARVQGARAIAALDAGSLVTRKFIGKFGSLGRMK